MTIKEITSDDQWKDLPLGCVVEFMDRGAVYVFARTCKSSLAAVQTVHKGAVPARSLRCFFPPGGALFNYACDSLMWEGESMQRDGVYWLVCAASRVGVNNGEDEAVALRACGGSQLPCAWDEGLCELVVQEGELGLLKWMRAQKPPCPCDFEACLELAEEGGAVWAYLQMGLDLVRMCSNTGTMTATETANAVGLIGQGADLHAKANYGLTPLHWACYNGHAEVAKALLEKGADVHAKDNVGWTPLHYACENGHAEVVKALLEKGADVHAKDNDGRTPLPLHWACANGHHDIAAMLRAKGAVD